jgi:lipoyl(octanoyl) transferase
VEALPAAWSGALRPSGAVPGAIAVLRPGSLSYADGLALQERLVEERRRGAAPDTLVLLEHEAVVTLGRGADPANVLFDRERLAARGIALFETGRGGDVTLHSPGQVVGYPIVALHGERRDTHRYLRDLEEVMILAARDFGVDAARMEGLTGIWTGGEKLGAIGVRLNSGWITSHGFAFNTANDLSLFGVIVPCGIRGRGVTSLSRLLGRRVAPEEAMDRLEARFRQVFAWLDGEPAGPAADHAIGADR